MNCVNCGHENPERALICYWCGLEPATGEPPYHALTAPAISVESVLALPEVELPLPVQVPSPLPVPEIQLEPSALDSLDLSVPELPSIQIAPPPEIPDQAQFTTIVRRRVRHRPVTRALPARPMVTRPVLPGWGRMLVFLVGLGLLVILGSVLVTAVGAATFGSAFCLAGLFGLAAVLWLGLLLARTGKRVVEKAGVTYERLEVFGRALREVAPGTVKELPVNLPTKMGVLDLPVAYSELRALASQEGEASPELAVDLLTGAIANLVGRDDVILARRSYPIEARGLLTRSTSTEINRPVLTRRRAHVGPGELEDRIADILRTGQPMTVEDLVRALVGPSGRGGAQKVVNWVQQALSENPPDLEALTSPDDALAELERFREAMHQANPELYQLLEGEVRRGLGGVAQRSVPSSLLDLARYAPLSSDRSRQSQRRSRPQRRG